MQPTREMDLNPLIRLKDALEGAQQNTSNMLSKLERFERRLGYLDDKMRPIQTTTKHYTKAKENISLTLIEVGKTYEYFRAATEVKDVVESGLNTDTQPEFFDAFRKLSNAKSFFEMHSDIKSASSVLGTLDGLFKQAVAVCVASFEKLLRSAGSSLESVDGKYNILNPLNGYAQRDIAAICEVLEEQQLDGHFKVYQTVRTSKLQQELSEFEDKSSAQWRAGQGQDGPYERGSHPFRAYFVRAYWLLRSELQLWGSTLPSNLQALQVFVALCDAVLVELNRVLHPLLHDELRSGVSSSNANPVVKKSKLLLQRLDVLETLIDLYEEFRDLCRPDVRQETSASLALAKMRFSVVQACMQSCEFLLSTALIDGFLADLNKKAGGIGVGVGTAGSSLGLSTGGGGGGGGSRYFDETEACDLHPATGNLLYCCAEVLSFDRVYRRMCDLTVELQVSVVEAVPTETDDFVFLVLENLLTALEDRSLRFDDFSKHKAQGSSRRMLSQQSHNLFEQEDKGAEEVIMTARKHLFLANNLYTVMNRVRTIIKGNQLDSSSSGGGSGDGGKSGGNSSGGSGGGGSGASSALAASAQQRKHSQAQAQRSSKFGPYLHRVEERLSSEQLAFCQTIARALGLTKEDMDEFRTRMDKDKDKNGQSRLLKVKFQVFNTGLDALLAQQGEWRVSAPGLRERLSSQLLANILPTYKVFFETYSAVKFSKKHMDEYLKYPPANVQMHLEGFFGRR